MRNNRMTVADLRAAKGRRKLTMIYVETPDEAAAAATAGIDLLSIIAPLWTADMRAAAGDCFVQVGLLYGGPVTAEDYLRAGFAARAVGGDAFYCGAAVETVRRMAAEGLPVVGHVGLVPSKATWTGGFKAVGKTAAV
jgi:3-methyl-2-oxobutanoate hydroxymethyltransferase